MLLAPDSIANQIRMLAREFLANMREGHYDQIWNYSITISAMDLISMTAFPLHLQAAGEIDAFLANPSSIQNMSFLSNEISLFLMMILEFERPSSKALPMAWRRLD